MKRELQIDDEKKKKCKDVKSVIRRNFDATPLQKVDDHSTIARIGE